MSSKAPAKKAVSKAAAPAKAAAAASSVKKGSFQTKSLKVRTSPSFYRPHTLRLQRNPKYKNKALDSLPSLDKYSIIKYPLCTESAMKGVEGQNTLTFIVDLRATKPMIKKAIKDLYNVKPLKVNTLIRPDGQKKAFVALPKSTTALDVANKIGFI